MLNRPVYHYEISPFRFALSRRMSSRRKSYWSALVSVGSKRFGLVVGALTNQPIKMPTRAELLSHLEYAYGKKPERICPICRKKLA